MTPLWLTRAEALRGHIAGRRWVAVKEVRWFMRHVLGIKASLSRRQRDALRKHLGLVSVSSRGRAYWAEPRTASGDIA